MTRADERPDSAEETAGAVAEDAEETSGVVEGPTFSTYLPPFRIDITVRPGVAQLASRHRVAAAIRAALEAAGAPGPASIGVVLSGDEELAQLNSMHMGSTGATDVLSFPFFPPEAFPVHERGGVPQRDPWVAAAPMQAS